MSREAPELYASLPPESQKIVDNVASAFISSLINILRCNFKQSRNTGGDVSNPEYTSSQRLAITFANKWFTGVLTELIYQLSNINCNPHLRCNFSKPDSFESQADNIKGNYTCSVPHTKIDTDGQIKVNYSAEMNSQVAELTAQDFGHLVLTGMQHQMAIKNTLQQFWSVCGSLVLKSVSKALKMPSESALSIEFATTDAGSKFDDFVFSKNWYQAVDESFGIVPINTCEPIEGIVGYEELLKMSKKLEIELSEAIEQAKVLCKIKSIIADQNNNM